MKLLSFIFLAFISLFVEQTYAQTVVGSCNSVSVTSEPAYPNDILISGGWKTFPNNNCQVGYTTSPPIYAGPRHWLEMKQTNGTWTTVQGGTGVHGNNVSFSVSTHGTYRVRFQNPRRQFQSGCPQTSIQVLNFYTLGHLGWRGEYSTNPTQDVSWSNEVTVGAAVQNDIAWNFIDGNNNYLFSPGEQVKMNTTGTKNYDSWWVAIFENGGQNRYWSNGWTQGQIPGNQINLSAYNPFPGGFQQIPVSYTVQFAISASCNTQWINLDRNFAVCVGCRIAEEEGITLYPNPANTAFQLRNLDISLAQQLRVILTDINGRAIKSFDQITQPYFDISDLNNGLYIVSIWEGERRIFASKLSVVK